MRPTYLRVLLVGCIYVQKEHVLSSEPPNQASCCNTIGHLYCKSTSIVFSNQDVMSTMFALGYGCSLPETPPHKDITFAPTNNTTAPTQGQHGHPSHYSAHPEWGQQSCTIDIMSIGYNIKGGSNGHFNHADLRGQCFFSLYRYYIVVCCNESFILPRHANCAHYFCGKLSTGIHLW